MDPEKIKSIVARNFDESVEIYETFERHYGLFRNLARMLSDFCGIKKGMTILDVGCGTGASTFLLSEEAGKVVGIDLSQGMVAIAQRERRRNTEFVVGDAEKLSQYFSERFDAALYNASIFLVPSPEKTLGEAKKIVRKDGVVGASYLLGLFSGYTDIIEKAREAGLARDGTFTKPQDIEDAFRNAFGHYEEKRIEIPLNVKEAEDFYSIPAQSASLFPKRPYEERLALTKNLFSHIEKEYGEMKMAWSLIKGRV